MRALLMLSVAMMCRAQSAELAAAAKSPVTLAKYVESHPNFGWDELWKALGVADPHIDFVPCGSGELDKCTTELPLFQIQINQFSSCAITCPRRGTSTFAIDGW